MMRWSTDPDPSWVLLEGNDSDPTPLPLDSAGAELLPFNPKPPSAKLRSLHASCSPYSSDRGIVSASLDPSNRHFPRACHHVAHPSLMLNERRPYSRSPLRALTTRNENHEKIVNDSLRLPDNKHFPETVYRSRGSSKNDIRRPYSRSPLRPMTVQQTSREITASVNPPDKYICGLSDATSMNPPQQNTRQFKRQAGKLAPLFLGGQTDPNVSIEGLGFFVRSCHSSRRSLTPALQQQSTEADTKKLNPSQTRHSLFSPAFQYTAMGHVNRLASPKCE